MKVERETQQYEQDCRTRLGWQGFAPIALTLGTMKTRSSILFLALSTASIALSDEPARGVCLDGGMERAFVVSAFIPQKALEGGYLPEVNYAEDGRTPKAITWTAASKVRPAMTVIGRFKGHEIIEITFPVVGGPAAQSDHSFEAMILAYRVGPSASAPMVPFFVIMGDQVRGYERVFTSDATDPFLLEVSRTIPGNGVMWSNFTFGFGEGGALIKEVNSGGRNQKTTVTKFRPDGTVASTEELEEN